MSASRVRPSFPALDILIVDDNAGMRTLLERVLGAAGAHVRSAPNGEAALAQYAQRPAHLVLLDHTMPGMSGAELAGHLRAKDDDLRIVMLSGHEDAHYLSAARAAGVDDVMIKPVSPRTLLERIEALMGAPSERKQA